MYRVVRAFADATDNEYIYHVGDQYPRFGKEVDSERLEELSSDRNRGGVVFIVDDTPEKASPEAEEAIVNVEAGVSPTSTPKAAKKPRKGQEKHA